MRWTKGTEQMHERTSEEMNRILEIHISLSRSIISLPTNVIILPCDWAMSEIIRVPGVPNPFCQPHHITQRFKLHIVYWNSLHIREQAFCTILLTCSHKYTNGKRSWYFEYILRSTAFVNWPEIVTKFSPHQPSWMLCAAMRFARWEYCAGFHNVQQFPLVDNLWRSVWLNWDLWMSTGVKGAITSRWRQSLKRLNKYLWKTHYCITL